MNTKIIIGVLVIGALFIPILIFGGKDDSNNVPLDDETTSAEVVVLPADMPENVPIYPGSKVERVEDTENNGERNITLTLTTEDSVSDVNEWYRGALNENSWAVTSDQNVGGYVLLKGERENLTVFMQAANRTDLGLVTITERIRIR